MFQEFQDEQDQHPGILDRVAITKPRAKSWNLQLTILVGFFFLMGVLLLVSTYVDMRSHAVRYIVQIWITWITISFGFMSLASAFLLRRRSQVGWFVAPVLISSMVVLFLIFLGRFIHSLSQTFIAVSELPFEIFLEMGLLPLGCFMLYLISQQTVRQIFGVPLKWFWTCLAMGVILGTFVGVLLT